MKFKKFNTVLTFFELGDMIEGTISQEQNRIEIVFLGPKLAC